MNKELRRISIVVLLMFLALFGSSTIIQVFQQDNLKADSRNVRQLYASFSAERGAILAGGQPIAESVPSDDAYKFQREYSNGPLYFRRHRVLHPQSGQHRHRGHRERLPERHREPAVPRPGERDPHRPESEGRRRLGHDRPVVQQAADDALGDLQGAVIALDPKTGAILAMVSKPDFDPNTLAVHDTSQVISTYKQLLADPGDPLINRAIAGSLNPPGSTFKLVVTAAALSHGYTPDSEFPNPPSLQLPQSNTVITNSEGGSCGGGATASIATALRLSCNIPFAQLGWRSATTRSATRRGRSGSATTT